MNVPNKLLVREYVWENINDCLYRRLIRDFRMERHQLGEVLQHSKQEQIQLLRQFLNSLSVSRPAIPEHQINYFEDPVCLLTELIEREEELGLIYQSYPYFLGTNSAAVSSIQRLTHLHKQNLNALRNLRNQLETKNKGTRSMGGQGDYWLEEGYQIEKIASGLTFPTSLIFNDDGELFVGEAGFSYGPAVAKAQILHIPKTGQIRVVASGFEGPLTGLAWHNNHFYVATGSFNGKIHTVSKNGEKQTVIEGLRGGGDHYTSEIVFGPDDKMYFGVGTVTNSAVVGEDNVLNGWLGLRKEYHDIPARDLILAGKNFESDNLLTKTNPNDRAVTGAFKPFGVPGRPGDRVKGRLLANGVIYRANADGSGLEIIADGIRNVFGLGFSPDGRLYATNNGFDFRGSRPIEGDWDSLYELTPGWYGWPDFASGLPVTLPYFKPPGHPQPEFILGSHPPIAEQPLIRFKPHTATQKFDFSTNSSFAPKGEIFLAQMGGDPPLTTSIKSPRGFRIVRADPHTGQVRDFFINLKPGKAGKGPERPLALRFSPDGNSLYIVDFGILEATAGTFIPHAETGAVWRIYRR